MIRELGGDQKFKRLHHEFTLKKRDENEALSFFRSFKSVREYPAYDYSCETKVFKVKSDRQHFIIVYLQLLLYRKHPQWDLRAGTYCILYILDVVVSRVFPANFYFLTSEASKERPAMSDKHAAKFSYLSRGFCCPLVITDVA